MNGPKADAILEKTNVKKKKKSTKKSTQIGSIKINEDDDLLNKPFNKDDDDNDNAVTVISNETKFKSISKPSNNDDDIANKDDNLDNDPVVVNDEPQIEEFKGGLKSAKQIRKENAERRQKEEAQRQVELEKMSKEQQNQNDTVYRDSTGRKIDIKAEEIERKRKKMEEDEKEAQKMEWGKGLVQREDRQRKQKEIDDMKNKPMARYHDDAEINAELMDVERWNDPAAAFMTVSSSSIKTFLCNLIYYFI